MTQPDQGRPGGLADGWPTGGNGPSAVANGTEMEIARPGRERQQMAGPVDAPAGETRRASCQASAVIGG